jgi:hypothetical protein
MEADVELFVAMAEIAGVFVGFGALISFTRRAEVEADQLGLLRAVVTVGLVVIVAALLPIGLSGYGVSGHRLWFWCSLVFLILVWAVILLSLRNRENRELARAQTRNSPVMAAIFWLLLEVPIQVPLALTVLGIFSALDAAFYTTALIFNLFEAAYVLARLVYAQAKG